MTSTSIERAILSSMVNNAECCDTGCRVLEAADFGDLFNARVFDEILKLRAEEYSVDLIILSKKFPEEMGELVTATNEVGCDSSFDTYCSMLKEERRFREASAGLEEIKEMVSNRDSSVFGELDKLSDKIHSLDSNKEIKFIGETDIVSNAIAELGNQTKGIMTGFPWVDHYTRGFQKGQMVVIGGRPSMGKSTFAMNIGMNMAKAGKTVAFFTMEDSTQTLMQRMTCALSLTPMSKFRSKNIQELEQASRNALEAQEQINKWKLTVVDNGSMTVEDISSDCYKIRAKAKSLDLVVVDYIGLIKTHKTKSSNRQQELGEVSHSLKRLAKDLDCTVLVVAQLNREADKGVRPKLSDIRECGDIEQDADIVLFPYRNQNPVDGDPYDAEIILAKNRNGEVGFNPNMSFVGELFSFLERTNDEV